MIRTRQGTSACPKLVRGLRLKLSYRYRLPSVRLGWVSSRFENFTEAWSTVKPTVLIVTTVRWFPTARLAVALANAGFTVDAVCPSRHPLVKTHAVHHMYEYHGLSPLASLRNAITSAEPDLIVPGDDLATQHLHLLYEQEDGAGESGANVRALVERSLGAPEDFRTLYARTEFMKLAEAQGIRVPRTEVICDASDLRN